MPQSWWSERSRRTRTIAALACVLASWTCDHEAAGPGLRVALAVEALLPATDLAAFNLTIDNVRLIVVRPPADTVLDRTFNFPADQSSLPIAADVPLEQSPETFHVTIQLLAGATLLFEGTQDVTLTSGQSPPPAQIPVSYSGPGQNVASLTIDPADSLLTQGATLQFRLTARDAQNAIVPTFYASWTTSDTLLAPVDATGLLTAPNARATVSVTARTPNDIVASTAISFVPVASAITIVSGCGQSGLPGAQLAQPVVVRVIAADQLGVPGITVQFTPPAGGAVNPAQAVTDANGLAQTTATLPLQGPAAFAIAAPGLTAVQCTQALLGATQLAFTTQPPTNNVAGSGWSAAVTAQDALGNTVTSFTGNVTLALGANPGGASSGTQTIAAVAGVATFAGLSIDKVGAGYTLVASSGSLTAATSAPFDVVAGPPARLVFSVPPASVQVGNPITPAVVVAAQDAYGNPTASFTGNVTLAFGANPGGATLGGTPTQAAITGAATFTDLTLDQPGIGYTLVASSGTLTPATSASFDVVPVSGLHLAFTGQPGSVTAGSVIAPAVEVTALDGQNNPVLSFTAPIAISLGTCPVGAVLSGTDTVNAVAGVASFNDLSIDKAGGCTLVAASLPLQNVSSISFTVAPGAPASVIKISGDNQSAAGGAALPQPLVVEVRDGFTNVVPGATVAWATADGGSFSPASGATDVNGRAQTSWTLGSTVTSQTATATVDALTPASFSATANVGTPAITLSFAGIPGVGVGLSAKVYVDLNQPAPAGGTAVTVLSGNTSVYTVAPGAVTIPQGQTRDSVTVTGVSSGQADLTASATGYTSGVLTVVVQNRNISVPQNLNVPYGQTASLPIQLPAPAPAGGVTFSVVSGAPGNVSVATPSVTIPAGGQTANATLNGVLPGPATITVSNPAYLDGITNAATTASLNIVQASASLNASFGTSITVNFESNGVGAAAPAPGISVSLTPTDPTCVAATTPVTIPTGLVNTTATLTYGGSATLPCTTKLLAQATNLQPDSITVTVNATPGITVGAVTVGSGLQINTSFTLGAPNHGNIDVTLTSSDPGVLLAPNATTAGQAQITIPVADGVQTVGFYVQGLEGRTIDTVRATVTVAAPGFSDGTATETALQAAIDLQGLPGATTTLSPSSFVYARTGIANAGNTALNQLQAVRAGAPGPLTVTFTTPANGIGELLKQATAAGVTQTATIPIGSSNSPTDTTTGGVAFHALLSGTTSVGATIPGFIATTQATRSITVTQPAITVGAVTVGSGLQINTSFTLGAPNHGNIDVTLTSSDPGVLLAPNATTAGQAQITIPVADGVQTVGFYVQGLEGRTTDTVRATVTVAAPGFSDGTATETALQAAIDLQGLPGATTTLSPSSFVYARTGIANAGNTALNQLQAVRAGAPGPLTVTFTTPANGIGELLKQATAAGVTQTATIPIGSSNSPTDTTTGGVAFHALLSGTTSVGATIPGFIATTQATRSITSTQPAITVGAVTVGSGLQINTSFTLGAPNHGNIDVTLTSSNPAVLLSPNAVTAGQAQITIPVADGVQTVGFYVQGLEGQTGTVTATATVSAPGFTNGTASETVVQAAIDLQGLPANTTPLTPSSFVYVRTGIANVGNTALNQLQAVRAGAPGPLTVTFTTPANGIGELLKQATPAGVTQTATIPIGSSNSPTDTTTGGVAFHPLAGLGTTTVSATIPGYIATTQATRSITNATPGISVGSLTVGSGLQANTSFTLGAPNHGNFTVTLTSSDPAILLSPDATTAGQTQITIPVADGVQTVGFYVQGLEGLTSTVSGSITVSAAAFTDGTAAETIVQAALDLQGVPATMPVGAADASVSVRTGIANVGNTALNQLQAVRAGLPGGSLVVSVTSSNVNAATLVNSVGATGSPQTVQILSGQSNSPTTVGAGGVAVRRVATGTSSISAAISGFITTGQGTRSVTVQ